MTLGLAYWIILLVWILFEGAIRFGYAAAYGGVGTLVLLALFVLLGWQIFGAPLRK